MDQQQGVPEQLVLDIDATDDPLHGEQEGRYFHGYYDCYCFLPLYVTCGSHVLSGQLRTANLEPAEGALAGVSRIVGQIRRRWPQVALIVRGDVGFCREELMEWCERQERVDYVFGLAQNARLKRRMGQQQERCRRRGLQTRQKSRRYRDFRYRTVQSWGRTRRVVGNAEWLPGELRNNNLRFVVTSLAKADWGTRELYEQLYCARGEMENRIKEQQYDLFADRTSAAALRANQLRLHWALLAAALLEVVRQVGLAGTHLARAQFGTIRMFRRQALFAHCLARLRAAAAS